MNANRSLAAYRHLMRVQRSLFRGDDFAQTQAVTLLRSEFEKNRHVTDENEVERLLSEGHDAAEFLKLNVVQAKLNDRGNYEMVLQQEHAGSVAGEPSLPTTGEDLGPLPK